MRASRGPIGAAPQHRSGLIIVFFCPVLFFAGLHIEAPSHARRVTSALSAGPYIIPLTCSLKYIARVI